MLIQLAWEAWKTSVLCIYIPQLFLMLPLIRHHTSLSFSPKLKRHDPLQIQYKKTGSKLQDIRRKYLSILMSLRDFSDGS